MAKKFSQFPFAASISPGDSVVGLKDGANTRFSFATVFSYMQSLFVPTSRKVNNKALNADIALDASDVGAVATSAVGAANGVASLDSNGKVPGTQLDLSGKQSTITASGILKGDGAGGVTAATAGTDYQAPLTAGTDYVTPAQLADKANPGQIGYPESSTTASRNYSAGEYICWNGLTYTADTNIALGAVLSASGGNKNLTECVGGGFNSLSNVTNDSVTFSNNVTGYTYPNVYHLSKSGNVVVTNIYMSTGSIAGAGTLLCTVPAAFRPSSNRSIAAWLTYNNESKVEMVQVKPDGEIITASGGSRVSGWIRVFGMYML